MPRRSAEGFSWVTYRPDPILPTVAARRSLGAARAMDASEGVSKPSQWPGRTRIPIQSPERLRRLWLDPPESCLCSERDSLGAQPPDEFAEARFVHEAIAIRVLLED